MKHALVLCLLLSAAAAHAQGPLPRELRGERLLVISPMVGRGTADDPTRPEVIPPDREWNSPEAVEKRARGEGIVGYSFTVSDDGKFALVELVARTPEAFAEIQAEKDRRNWKVFRKGAAKKADIEAEFRKHKPDFDVDNFTGPKAERDRAAQEVGR